MASMNTAAAATAAEKHQKSENIIKIDNMGRAYEIESEGSIRLAFAACSMF